MNLFRDRATRFFFLFLVSVVVLFLLFGIAGCHRQTNAAKRFFLSYECAVAGSLIEQGVPEEIIAYAITSAEESEAGKAFLTKIGVREQTSVRFLSFLSSFHRMISRELLMSLLFLSVLLFGGAVFFFHKQDKRYKSAAAIIRGYMEDDFSHHLPQLHEGAVYEMFSAVEQLATMQRSKNEAEIHAKQFLKHTISDLSHQLKTPLAALAMYQEIIEEEPENSEVVKMFSIKMSAALNRMERLIWLILKITRLDAGSIVFERKRYQISEVVRYAVGELTMRARAEKKELVIVGDERETLVCDMEWTAEAVGNLVKNALDHTSQGDHIRISWERCPTMLRLSVEDDGCGISDEDIHHIFKRFYRSKSCSDTQGIGLGLPLAKAIVEGEGGVISVQSHVGEGTVFKISLPYETVS